MKRPLVFLDFTFILFVVYQLFTAQEQTKVLFIGNSFTYRNEMPDIFEHIAISKGKHVFVESVTRGKATIKIHSNRQEVYNAIVRKKWDYVIIQGSSRDFIQPDSILNTDTYPALEKLLNSVRNNSAKSKLLFFMTWGYENGYVPNKETDTYEKMTFKVRDNYLKLKNKYHVGVVPVGMAWKDSRYKRQSERLYVKDGAHPSLKGSYLAASCFYASIFNESAIGSTYYGKLGPNICYYLQSVGSRNVLYQRKKYGLTY